MHEIINEDTPEETKENDNVEPSSPVSNESTQEDIDVPLGRRKKGSTERYFVFTVAQEDELIDWWREHEWFYNPEHPLAIDKGRKVRLYEERPKNLAVPVSHLIVFPFKLLI